MMTEGNGLAELIWNVLEQPEKADANALLVAANACLDTATAGDEILLSIGRSMAATAMDVAVFGDGYRPALINRCRAYWMAFAAIESDAHL